MRIQDRRKILLYLTLVTLGMVLLAASLSGLQLRPGLPFPGADPAQRSRDPVQAPDFPASPPRPLPFPLALGFAGVLILLTVRLVKKVGRAQTLRWAGGLLVVAGLFILLSRARFASPGPGPGDSQDIGGWQVFDYAIAPIGDPPVALFRLVVIGLLLGAVLLAAWFFYPGSQRSRKGERIAAEAGAALAALREGQDLGNTILRCYLQMETVLKEEKGIERAGSLTTREFERWLAAQGITVVQIHTLIGLFEKVRYGRKNLGPQDEQAALECLSAIRSACESPERELP